MTHWHRFKHAPPSIIVSAMDDHDFRNNSSRDKEPLIAVNQVDLTLAAALTRAFDRVLRLRDRGRYVTIWYDVVGMRL